MFIVRTIGSNLKETIKTSLESDAQKIHLECFINLEEFEDNGDAENVVKYRGDKSIARFYIYDIEKNLYVCIIKKLNFVSSFA